MGEVLAPGDIRARRERLGLSQSELARMSGVSRPQIYRIEMGLCSPRHSTLRRLSDALASETIRQARLKLTREELPRPDETVLVEAAPGAKSILELIDADLPLLASVMVRVTSRHSGRSRVMSAIDAMGISEGFEEDFTFEIVEPRTFEAQEVYQAPHPRRLTAKLQDWKRKKPD